MSNTQNIRNEEIATIDALQGKLDAGFHAGRMSLTGYNEMTADLQLRREQLRRGR